MLMLAGFYCPSVLHKNRVPHSLRKLAHAMNRFFQLKIKKKIPSEKKKVFFLYFAQNIGCGYTLELPHRTTSEGVLTSTHNLCFGPRIRKIGIPVHTSVLLYKRGFKWGIHCTDMFS